MLASVLTVVVSVVSAELLNTTSLSAACCCTAEQELSSLQGAAGLGHQVAVTAAAVAVASAACVFGAVTRCCWCQLLLSWSAQSQQPFHSLPVHL